VLTKWNLRKTQLKHNRRIHAQRIVKDVENRQRFWFY
jgi:hypothetical protein